VHPIKQTSQPKSRTISLQYKNGSKEREGCGGGNGDYKTLEHMIGRNEFDVRITGRKGKGRGESRRSAGNGKSGGGGKKEIDWGW